MISFILHQKNGILILNVYALKINLIPHNKEDRIRFNGRDDLRKFNHGATILHRHNRSQFL